MRDLGDMRCVFCGLLRQTVPVGMRSCVQATTRCERIVGRVCPHCHGVSSAVHGGPNASVRVFRCPHASERVQGGCSLCAQRWVNNHTPAVWTPSRTRAAHTSARPYTHTCAHTHAACPRPMRTSSPRLRATENMMNSVVALKIAYPLGKASCQAHLSPRGSGMCSVSTRMRKRGPRSSL